MSDGPDFICIGMMKTGTAWLYDQLQYHPDFWMPPVKEMHYLDRDDNRGINAGKLLHLALRRPEKLKKISQAAQRPWDKRDLLFLEEMAGHRGGELDLERYASLFRHKADRLSGDITPQYGALKPDMIAKIASGLPDVRGILFVRDPVARAWSQISMLNRLKLFDAKMLEDTASFSNFLNTKKFRNFAFATETMRRWTENAPQMQIRVFFFDDIADSAASVRSQILTFLGADPNKASGQIDAGYNKKSGKRKLELTEKAKAVLIENFRDELLASAAMFGGHAERWPALYGV